MFVMLCKVFVSLSTCGPLSPSACALRVVALEGGSACSCIMLAFMIDWPIGASASTVTVTSRSNEN